MLPPLEVLLISSFADPELAFGARAGLSSWSIPMITLDVRRFPDVVVPRRALGPEEAILNAHYLGCDVGWRCVPIALSRGEEIGKRQPLLSFVAYAGIAGRGQGRRDQRHRCGPQTIRGLRDERVRAEGKVPLSEWLSVSPEEASALTGIVGLLLFGGAAEPTDGWEKR